MMDLEGMDKLEELTIGPDGTMMGLRGAVRVTMALDLYWIEATYRSQQLGAVRSLVPLQDCLSGPDVPPPGFDYLPAIRGSSFTARVAMLKVACKFVGPATMADHLGLSIATLKEIVAVAYDV